MPTREVTYQAERGIAYVLLDDDGATLDVYTYADSPLIPRTVAISGWESGRNPMFLHASNAVAVRAYLERHWQTTDLDD